MNSLNVVLTSRNEPASVDDDLPLRIMSISPCAGGKGSGEGEHEEDSLSVIASLSEDSSTRDVSTRLATYICIE